MPKDTTTAKITIDARDLTRALRFAMQVVKRRSTIPILSCNLFRFADDKLTITGTDLDIECEASCDAESERIEAARFVMDGRQLLAFAAMTTGLIHISIGEGEITIAADGAVMTLRNLLPPEDWPVWVEGEGKPVAMRVGEADMRRALHRVRHCISTEETRYYLNGVHWCAHPETKALRLVTTDGHRMAIYDLDQSFGAKPFILPKKTAEILYRALRKDGNGDVAMIVAENGLKAVIETPAGVIRSKMIDGNYPDYTRVLLQAEAKIACTVGEAMIRRLMVVSGKFARAVAFRPEEKRVTCRDPYGNEIAIPMQFTGEPIKSFGFNGGYLIDHCRAAGGAIRISGSGHGDPFRILSDDPRALWVQMPMLV